MNLGGARAGWAFATIGATISAVIGAAACGGGIARGQAGGTSSGAGGAGTSSSTSTSSSSSSGGTGGQACAAAVAAIAQASTGQGSCTAVVRIDDPLSQILGFQILCGPYTSSAEAPARATAQQDTGFGQTGTSLSGAMPPGDFVFWQTASDFGGSAAVAARNGRSVFGGSTVWAGKGDITYPKTWRPAADIGDGCAPPGIPPPTGTGYELGGGTALDPAQVSAALARVWQTALPAGLWQVGYVFDEMVLRYPRTVGGPPDPATTEWIVLVNAGFLE